MNEISALVVGGGRGLGRGVVAALANKGVAVTALARTRAELEAVAADTGATPLTADAAEDGCAPRILAELRPRIVVLVAGAPPTLLPLQEHTWETFSKNWAIDTKIAFEWVRASLSLPRGAHVVVFSSGAAVAGSPLTGGYAGAKRAQWFLTDYAAGESRRLELEIRYHCLVPALNPSTQLGRDAIAAYASRAGISEEAYASRFAPFLTPQVAGEAVLQLVEHPGDWPDLAYRLGGAGMRAV